MKIFALAALVGAATAFTDERQPDVEHPDTGLTVDLVNSTKLVGLIGWSSILPPTVDPEIPVDPTCKDKPEGCDPGDPDAEPPVDPEDPDVTVRNDYVCAYRIRLLQPFQIISQDRYVLFVGHNCPEEIIDTFSFNFRFPALGGSALTTTNATQGADDGDAAVVASNDLVRKQAGVTGVDNDEAGILFPEAWNQDGTAEFTYAYLYGPGTWLL